MNNLLLATLSCRTNQGWDVKWREEKSFLETGRQPTYGFGKISLSHLALTPPSALSK